MRIVAVSIACLMAVAAGCDGNDEPGNAKPVGLGDFESRVVDEVCTAYRDCHHQGLRGAVTTLMVVALADDIGEAGARPVASEVEDTYRAVVEGLTDEQRVDLPSTDCEKFTRMVLRHQGYTTEQLRGIVADAQVVYDAGQAGECVQTLRQSFSGCDRREDFELPEVDMHHPAAMLQHYRLVLEQHGGEFESLYSACSEVVEGRIPAGGPCRFDYQCVDELECVFTAGEDQGECVYRRRQGEAVEEGIPLP